MIKELKPSYSRFVKRTRTEDKGHDFRFHPHTPEVSDSNPLPAVEMKPEYTILWVVVCARTEEGAHILESEDLKMNHCSPG